MNTDNKFVRSLLQNAQRGNASALEQLFSMNFGKVYALALRLTADKSLANKITKDTFIDAWKQINRIRDDMPFGGWLSAITVYKTLSELREKGEDKKKNDLKEIDSASELDNNIFHLPLYERIAFVLIKVEKYSVAEASDLIGMKKDQFETHLNHALAKLTDKNPLLKNENFLKEEILQLPIETQPPSSTTESVFSVIYEQRLKEAKEKEIDLSKEVEEEKLDEEPVIEEKVKKEKFSLPDVSVSVNTSVVKRVLLGLIALVVIAAVIYFLFLGTSSWEITAVKGKATVNGDAVSQGDNFDQGTALITADNSTVTINIKDIGNLEVDANTKISRLSGNNQLRLEKGKITKSASNSKESVSVLTQLAEYREYSPNSSYILTIDEDYTSTLNVKSGQMTVDVNGFESYVPKGYYCVVSRDHLAVPYNPNSNPELIQKLINFTGSTDPQLSVIVTLASTDDALSLWHVLQMASTENRGIVYNRLFELVPHGQNITKEGVMKLDEKMLQSWLDEIQVSVNPFHLLDLAR